MQGPYLVEVGRDSDGLPTVPIPSRWWPTAPVLSCRAANTRPGAVRPMPPDEPLPAAEAAQLEAWLAARGH